VKEDVTAADTIMLFGIQFIFARDLVRGGSISEWPNVERWVENCEGTDSYKRAVQKTGHKL
jgi:glutathione S-transferase